jgi:thiamine pyrophosphate-dependent acetolactate synthase large subunit-like protein
MPDVEPRSFSKSWKGEGVAYIFGNPGTTELPVMDALLLRTRAQVRACAPRSVRGRDG